MDDPIYSGRQFTFEEYLELERSSEIRHEFYHGELFAMSGGTKKHNRIVRNIARLVEDRFLSQGCRVYSENVKLEVISNIYYPYPDVILTCDPEADDDDYIVRNPKLLVEVTSESTEANDRGFKLRRYQKIPTLQYYLIVSQSGYLIDVYGRRSSQHVWVYQLFEGKESVLDLTFIDLKLRMTDIYRYVEPGA